MHSLLFPKCISFDPLRSSFGSQISGYYAIKSIENWVRIQLLKHTFTDFLTATPAWLSNMNSRIAIHVAASQCILHLDILMLSLFFFDTVLLSCRNTSVVRVPGRKPSALFTYLSVSVKTIYIFFQFHHQIKDRFTYVVVMDRFRVMARVRE